MKAIIVIDMPSDCANCQFCGYGGKNLEKYVCSLTREHSESPHLVDCPLKPMPKYYPPTSNPHRIEYLKKLGMVKKEQHYYELGHDDCIDEILGETE